MKFVKDVNVSGKKVLVRVDFNVPYDEHQNITDDTRIRSTLSTFQYLLDNEAIIIICSHMGRPMGKKVPELTLAPVAKRLGRLLGQKVNMAPDCIGDDVKRLISNLSKCDILLLENLRFYAEESDNNDDFAKELASFCDIYVNDAFAVSHRNNASVVAITKFAPLSVSGFLLQRELNYLKKAMDEPHRPLVAVIGGAKVSGKLEALKNMLKRVDKLIIGGAMANTFLRSMGMNTGSSMVEENLVEVAASIIKEAAETGVNLYLPVDVVAANHCDAKAEVKLVTAQEIPSDWMALDIGPASSLLFSEALYNAKTIIWNGPMGVFEIDQFSRGTLAMVESIANSYALTIVGGGDTDVAVHMAGESSRITYISTGGGAFLSLMEGKVLPAVAALQKTAS